MEIEFTKGKAANRLISDIVDRAIKLHKKNTGNALDKMSLHMDISAANVGCPLDLTKLFKADNFNFVHDVYGIMNHIDRKTGKLTRSFLPRTAKGES